MAEPTSMRCDRFFTVLCMMTSMSIVVVRLSSVAESTKVASVMVHSRRFGLRVRIHSLMKSKQPLFCRISVIDIVASRNMTISAARPTYFRNSSS